MDDIRSNISNIENVQSSRVRSYSRADLATTIVEKQLKKKKIIKRRHSSVDAYKKEINVDDHLIPIATVLTRYGTNMENGLTTAAAREILKATGRNALKPPKTNSTVVIFFSYLFGGFAVILWIGAGLCFVAYFLKIIKGGYNRRDSNEAFLGGVILMIIIVTGLFGFYQEFTNMRIMSSFKNMIPNMAIVIRDGVEQTINSEELVLGDLVVLKDGECVPSDVRIVQTSSLKVDNSSITGESDPQLRLTESTDENPLETANLAYFGTHIVEGEGKGIVIACGNNTLMGHIAALTAGLHVNTTPIKHELELFTRYLMVISLFIGIVFFIVGLCFGNPILTTFIYMIAIVVANVPEGLPVTMTAALTLTAKKMASKNCLCKNLHAVETLGATSVICSDKTGTLTQNKMTVAHIMFDCTATEILNFTGTYQSSSYTFSLLARCGTLCSRVEQGAGEQILSGDASETAVMKCMERLVGGTKKYRESNEKVAEIPFNSTNKYQVSIHKSDTEDKFVLVLKGAPERIIEFCSVIVIDGQEVPLTPELRRKNDFQISELGFMGERVLGFADLELPTDEFPPGFQFETDPPNFPLDNLRLLGYMSMIDPPRPGVKEAVEACKRAGIRVIMVTGDHPITASAIAKSVSIISPGNDTAFDLAMRRNQDVEVLTKDDLNECDARVVTGNELRGMSAADLDEIIQEYSEIVFARTSPQQKLLIVEGFQRAGDIVAVTGDGVNDSPALKKANIGIAMGISGSNVSKEAADMILLDDNFSSIVTGIEEGRLIFENIKKSVAYMLTSNVPEMFPFVMFYMLKVPLPISIMAILIIDVGTDLWPAISIAYEKAEADIMMRRPRNPFSDRLVTVKLLLYTNITIGSMQTLAGLSSYFFVMSMYGFLPRRVLFSLDEWDSDKNDMMDSAGVEWTLYERKILHRKCIASYFLAIVMTQVADCLIVKTRRLSLFTQGMANCPMNMGISFEIFLAIVCVYVPGLNKLLDMENVNPECLLAALPFTIFIVVFDEARKFFIRKSPHGWVFRETYY